MRSLPIDRPTLDDPIYSQKNPHQVFLLLLSIVSSIPLLQGHANSAALERELDSPTLMVWGGALLTGSVFALVGDFWRGHTWDALNIERFGLALVSVAALVYSWIVWRSAPDQNDVAFAAAITAAYGWACAWRCVQNTVRLRWIKQLERELATYRAERAEESGDSA